MSTLKSMLINEPDLELTLARPSSAVGSHGAKATGVSIMSVTELLAAPNRVTLKAGSLVLVAGALPLRIRGRTAAAIEVLLQQMEKQRCTALVVTGPAGACHVFPQSLRDLSDHLGIPLVVTSAPVERWRQAHDDIMNRRLASAERRATQLNLLIQNLPVQLSDPKALQRIADWLAQALDAQVLVSEPTRVLAASPPRAAEHLAQAIIRQSVEGTHHVGQTTALHTQLIPLAPSMGAEAVLAVATRSPLSDADGRLIRHVAKILGLVDQARREYRAASDATQAARTAAVELLMDGEPHKARRVMGGLAPGLLETDMARIFVIEVAAALRNSAVRRCESASAGQALVVADPREPRRVLIIQPVRVGDQAEASVTEELKRIVADLAPDSSMGGSGVYSLSLMVDALHEATAAQRFAVHQPNAVTLCAQDIGFISLLPQREAQRWARKLLNPLIQHQSQWDQFRETLPIALAYPYIVAARRLDLHRNTVTRRVARAAELLHLDLGSVLHRTAVGLALELVTQREQPAPWTRTEAAQPPSLRSLLASPQLRDWADMLLRSARSDRRNLLATASSWLACDAHVEKAARALGLSDVTVRAHIRALEGHTSRDLASLNGLRDLQFSLYIATGRPDLGDVDAKLYAAA